MLQKTLATKIDARKITRWGPTPQDLLLRRWILTRAKGALQKRVDAVAWQRASRAKDEIRLRKLERLRARLRGKNHA
ncbi:hypothetical protein HY629_02365 [Candidatus Uhrbacteria bacterium]|nr:hypothetical protein [Candidatus Uhrbacteria bacterium]